MTFSLSSDIDNNKANDLKKMNDIGERFSGFRSIVAIFMYKVYDKAKEEGKVGSPKKKRKKS